MKSYNDLLKQLRRIDAIWSSVDFSPSMDIQIGRALKIFYRYKDRMQQHLARFDKYGREAKGFWVAKWDANKDTKLSRSIYAGY